MSDQVLGPYGISEEKFSPHLSTTPLTRWKLLDHVNDPRPLLQQLNGRVGYQFPKRHVLFHR